MDISQLKEALLQVLLGAGFFGVFKLWKVMAIAWVNWFPLFRKAAQFALWGALIGLALLALNSVTASTLATHWSAAALALGLAVPALYGRHTAPPEQTVNRGARIAEAKDVTRMVQRQKKPADIQLGGVPLPVDAEPYHLLVTGSTGSGKSVAIRTLLDTIRERGDTAILVDSGGEFLTRFWRPETDFIINPFDDRCAPWSPLAEIAGPWDTEALSRSIIPDGTGDSKEWNNYAQTFLGSCLRQLVSQGRTTMADLMWAVQSASIPELAKLLEGTPAKAQLTSEKTFGSIRTIAANYMASYNYLANSDNPFSVAKFIAAERPGFLYLTYREDQLDSLRNMISCVLDVAARAILSLEPRPDRRVWLIIDEFASIGKVQSVEAVATKARKVGGCLVLGLQSVSQLRERYGTNSAQTILSCLSTWLVLRATDAETADYISKYLGESEVIRANEGQSTSDSGNNSENWSQQRVVERLVLAAEIQQLANLQGYLKLAGDYPVCPVALPLPPQAPAKAAAFEKRALVPARAAVAERVTAEKDNPPPASGRAAQPVPSRPAVIAEPPRAPNRSAGGGLVTQPFVMRPTAPSAPAHAPVVAAAPAQKTAAPSTPQIKRRLPVPQKRVASADAPDGQTAPTRVQSPGRVSIDEKIGIIDALLAAVDEVQQARELSAQRAAQVKAPAAAAKPAPAVSASVAAPASKAAAPRVQEPASQGPVAGTAQRSLPPAAAVSAPAPTGAPASTAPQEQSRSRRRRRGRATNDAAALGILGSRAAADERTR